MGSPSSTPPPRPAGINLASEAMRGDRAAIDLLWDLHRRWIAAVLLAHKPSLCELEDLLQEVAMTFVARIDTLRDPTSLRAWLRAIAVNAARAAGRSGRLRQGRALPSEQLLADGGDHVEAIEADERIAAMLRRLAGLAPEYREPLLLRAVQGLPSKRIAEILGVQPATVDTRIARARRMLRERQSDAPCGDQTQFALDNLTDTIEDTR